jgi:DNA polymerase III epsilon subunit-like protein
MQGIFTSGKKIIFPKDILIIDFESSSEDAETSIPVQLGAVLLDKNTLAEKKSFTSFIKTDLSLIPESRMTKKTYSAEKIHASPTMGEVARQFIDLFDKDYFISSWAANLDSRLFKILIKSAGFSFAEFDYHIYDIWPVAYTFLLNQGYTGPWESEHMFHEFGLPSRGVHDALEDCRCEAEILRIITNHK